ERSDRAFVIDEAIELGALRLCFVERIADIDHHAGQDLHMLGTAPGFLSAALHIGAEFAAGIDVRERREDRIGDLGAKLPPGIRRTGRATLSGPRTLKYVP